MAGGETRTWTFDDVTPEAVCRGVTRGLGLGGGDLMRLTKARLVETCLELAAIVVGAVLEIRSLEGGTPCAGAVTVTDADAHDALVWQARRDSTDSNMRPSDYSRRLATPVS